ncbi:hypothetical protein KKH24_02840 [Patescibacteria group bacterium]|nr:hypothetical protein [Patescibacteria group bacterium]
MILLDTIMEGGQKVIRWLYDVTIGAIINSGADLTNDALTSPPTPQIENPFFGTLALLFLYIGIVFLFLFILSKMINNENKITETMQGGVSYLAGLGFILFAYGNQLYAKADLIVSGNTSYFLSVQPDLVTSIFAILVGSILGILLGWTAVIPMIIILVVYIFVDTTGEFLIQFMGVLLMIPLTRTAGKIGAQVIAVNMIVPAYISFLILIVVKASENSGWNVLARSALVMGLFFFIAYIWYRLFDWATDHRYHERFHGVWQRSFGRYGRRKGDDQPPYEPPDERKYDYTKRYYEEEEEEKRKKKEEASSHAPTEERQN